MTVIQLLKKNRKQFIRYIIGALMTTIHGMSFTLALSNAFGIIEEPTTDGVVNRVIITVILILIPIASQLISRYLRIGFMRDVLIQVRTLAYQKVLSMSYGEYKKQSKEFYMSHLVSDINLFEKDFFLSLLNIIYCFGSFTFGSLLLIWIHPLISLMTAAISIVLYMITLYFEPIIKKAKENTQKANEDINVEISNVLNGMEIIKLYHVEEQFKNPFQQIIIRLENIKNIAFKKDSYHESINYIIASSYQMLIFVYATYLYTQNKLSITSLIIVFNLMGQMIWSLINGFNFINRFKTSILIFNKITKQEEVKVGKQSMKFASTVAISNLSYTYDQELFVLENINFYIKHHTKVLITGPSGVGKTTLLNCLTQNLLDYQGSIMIDNVDLQDVNHQEFLKRCGYIRQEHFLFNDSIKNNIVLNQKYDSRKLANILKAVDLYDWISSLEEQENHILVQDGSNISGGQRQRISIARELYHDKEVLFIDEPSASLDDYTSQKVYDTLLALDKTIVCVSHRHLDYLKERFDHVVDLEKKGDNQ